MVPSVRKRSIIQDGSDVSDYMRILEANRRPRRSDRGYLDVLQQNRRPVKDVVVPMNQAHRSIFVRRILQGDGRGKNETGWAIFVQPGQPFGILGAEEEEDGIGY